MIFGRKKKWENYSGNINIYDDLNTKDIPKILAEKNLHSVQLYEFKTPKKQTWQALDSLFKNHPHIGLRVLWYDRQDLAFYRQIPNVRNFTIASYHTSDYTPLLFNTELYHLGIEETKSTAVDLSFIKEFQQLQSLYIDGMKKGLENVRHLKNLSELTFRGVKLKNLDFLLEANKLEKLRLLFGSYKSVDALAHLKQLKSIEFSRVRQIPDFDFLNNIESLESIEFEGMSTMEEIPDLSELSNLKTVAINNNLRLNDISAVEKIKNLEVLRVSFAENAKAANRKKIIAQGIDILMKSDTIKYSTLQHWADETTKAKLIEKGIKKWEW